MLRERFGFSCSCSACSLTGPKLLEEDRLRQEVHLHLHLLLHLQLHPPLQLHL